MYVCNVYMYVWMYASYIFVKRNAALVNPKGFVYISHILSKKSVVSGEKYTFRFLIWAKEEG